MFGQSKTIGARARHSWLLAAVSRVIAARRRQRSEARTIAMLSALDDRTLADIGVARDQIPVIAQRLARRYGGHN